MAARTPRPQPRASSIARSAKTARSSTRTFRPAAAGSAAASLAASRPPLPVEAAVLDGFRAMLDREAVGARQIGDGSGRSEERRGGKGGRGRRGRGNETQDT